MAIPNFTFDVEVHSKLGNDPNVDNDLTAEELKAKFDSPAVAVKNWINNSLLPALNKSVPVYFQTAKPDNAPCIWVKPVGDHAAELNYVDAGFNVTKYSIV